MALKSFLLSFALMLMTVQPELCFGWISSSSPMVKRPSILSTKSSSSSWTTTIQQPYKKSNRDFFSLSSLPINDGDDNKLVQKKSDYDVFVDRNRRNLWLKSATRALSLGIGITGLVVLSRPAWAAKRSRTDGYAVQKPESEWKQQLSPMQYHILREGGTEKPYFSILEGEKRTGIYKCAGCGTALFYARDKFHSGTGWPSFARASDDVEIEQLDPLSAKIGGSELRCKTCGGHLGDVFQDGFIFVGTEAAKTNRRFCIDGAALVFYPDDNDDSVRGDIPASKDQVQKSKMEGYT